MPFDALDETTFGNALSLNRAYLKLVASDQRPGRIRQEFADSLTTLSGVGRERLARAPFLLFSLGDYDVGRWRSAAGPADPDLFHEPMPVAERQLVTETLAVVWALSQTNRYAARYLCGSGTGWCDYAAATPLPELIAAATMLGSLVEPRIPEHSEVWRKLVLSASDDRQFVRRAARLSALQCVLTTHQEAYAPARAASTRRGAALGVAESRGRRGKQR